jgi:hypothetical protein
LEIIAQIKKSEEPGHNLKDIETPSIDRKRNLRIVYFFLKHMTELRSKKIGFNFQNDLIYPKLYPYSVDLYLFSIQETSVNVIFLLYKDISEE